MVVHDGATSALLVTNERLKLRAAYLNGLAIAVFAIGSLAPVVGAVAALTIPGFAIVVIGAVCFSLSYGLHLRAMNALRGLQQ